jgi:hypothetical protein
MMPRISSFKNTKARCQLHARDRHYIKSALEIALVYSKGAIFWKKGIVLFKKTLPLLFETNFRLNDSMDVLYASGMLYSPARCV